jgi:hypothetical protein
MGLLSNKQIKEKYSNRTNRNSVILTKHTTILKKIRHYLKEKKLCVNFNGVKKNELIDLFLNTLDVDIPSTNAKKLSFIFQIYESGKYEFLRAQIDRPDIPSSVWKNLRDMVFEAYGKVCLCCGSQNNISVDHIKPYSLYPHLCIDFNNLQPLCQSCNSKKSNRHIIDYRDKNNIDK